MMWDGGWGWMLFGGVFMLIFWIAVIFLVVWGIKKLTENRGSAAGSNALDIARERYAKGEISQEEFQNIKKHISS
jgi:putative membrane protein